VRAPVTAAVLAVLVLSLAGCGGSSGSSSTHTSPLSAKEWRSRANAICRNIGGEVRRVRKPKSYAEITPFVAAVVPLWREQEDRIRALIPPDWMAGSISGYLQSMFYLESALVEIHIATERNDGTRRAEAVEKTRKWAFYMRQAAHVIGGLPACINERIP
jgi:hypothetical protein